MASLPELCGHQNVRAIIKDNTEQNTKDTASARIEIKIPDLDGNLTLVAGLEGRDSTDHATTTE